MTEINTNQERILITGVSGLVGGILFNYLTTTYPIKYQVFGLDRYKNISTRYQAANSDEFDIKTRLPVPSNKFIQCDITERRNLHEIIEDHKIDIIIHLAAVLENHPDIQTISDVNIQGTKNIFDAPGVRRIIYASSVRTVFGYLTREPYKSIVNGNFDDTTMLQHLTKLNVSNDPPLPDEQTPGNKAYDQSKIIGEQMAADIVKNTSKSIICLRFGSVNIENIPETTWVRSVWFSYRDVCSCIDKALQAPPHISGTYFATSNNHRLWIDLDDIKRDLGFVPQDGAKN